MLNTSDLIVIGLYFALVGFIAIWVTRKNRKTKEVDAKNYFLSGRKEGWLVIGASLFASNIGSEHLVGLAGAGARGDLVAAQFEILACLILIVLGWVFVPYYLKSGVYTMPEFLEKRYNAKARTFLSIVSVLSYVLTKISVIIFAGALVFEVLLGVPFWTGALFVVIATGAYTIFGGLKAVIYTDFMQMFVLVFGSLALLYFSSNSLAVNDGSFLDGILGIKAQLGEATTGKSAEDYFNLWRPFDDPDYPWTGIIFGAPILGIWYWCTDQFIVQRVLSAKDISTARRGSLFGGFLKLTPLFLFAIPGIIAFTHSIQNPSLLQTEAGIIEFDLALPALILNYLPAGFKGLMIAGLLAALMSSLSSVFNSCSTLITFDFYQRYKPNATQKQLVRFGQLSTVILVIVGLAWIPMMKALTQGEGIFKYLQSVQAYISPPVAAIFIFGLFFKRLNGSGALKALWVGLVLGVFRLLLEYFVNAVPENALVESLTNIRLVHYFLSVNFLHFAVILFVVSTLVLFVGSQFSTGGSSSTLELFNLNISKLSISRTDLLLTILLVLAVIFLWLIFSPIMLGSV